MTITLKALALASAALLALPATSYADASLGLVENSITDWTLTGSGFSSFELNLGSVPLSAGAFTTSFTPITSVSFSGTWADISDGSTPTSSGKEFVVTGGSNPIVVAELNGQVSFTATKGTFSGILYLGEAGPGDANPFFGVTNVASIMDQGGVETIPFAADNSSITIDTSAVPEPASIALLGSGLLALGTTVRRRRRKSDR